MAVSLTFNGTSHSIPTNRQAKGWGTSLSAFLVDVGNNALSKAGGSFVLTADTNFGSTYGLVTKYLKSVSSNIANTGVIRLARADEVVWRNQANGADLALGVNSSNILTFNSIPVFYLALGTADHVLKMNSGGTAYEFGEVANANIASAAAIARSKIAVGTADHVVINSGTGAFSSEATLALSRGGTGTAAGSANAAFNALSPLTTKGDIQTYSTVNARLGVGGNGTVLMADSAETTGLKWAAVAATVTTTRGDLIRRGASADERFSAVTDNRVVAGDGTDVVSKQIDDPAFFSSGAYADGTNGGILPPVTSMSNALATQLGLKQYLHGTTYNGGNAPTISGTNWTPGRGSFVPYQMQDGTWRMKFNLAGSYTSSSSTNVIVLTLAGGSPLFKNGYDQSVSVYVDSGSPINNNISAKTTTNASTIVIVYNGGGINMLDDYSVSGDVELNAKPNWAY